MRVPQRRGADDVIQFWNPRYHYFVHSGVAVIGANAVRNYGVVRVGRGGLCLRRSSAAVESHNCHD